MGIKALKSGELDMSLLAAGSLPGMMRASVRCRLEEWGVTQGADDVYVVVSELITNAVRFTCGREIRVRLVREDGAVMFGVWDASDEMPVVRVPGDLRPDARALDDGHTAGMSGRGLALVQALSVQFDVVKTRPCGKWVWAKVAV